MASAASLAGNWMISTFAGSTPYCRRITLSRLTLASVRPTTPMRRPVSWLIFVMAGAAFFPLVLTDGGTHSTTTFLRSVATACAFFGTSRSPLMMARSALPSPSRLALASAPSVRTGRNRPTLFRWVLEAWVRFCAMLGVYVVVWHAVVVRLAGGTPDE